MLAVFALSRVTKHVIYIYIYIIVDYITLQRKT